MQRNNYPNNPAPQPSDGRRQPQYLQQYPQHGQQFPASQPEPWRPNVPKMLRNQLIAFCIMLTMYVILIVGSLFS
ncbi:hypothetical protein [Salininema proteolyticum]|uniref:Uncharacterized protein n=1 Tax=Salininema proteolyticum TaxID=1607685 RepID=A0ABV8TYK9_9ACTN